MWNSDVASFCPCCFDRLNLTYIQCSHHGKHPPNEKIGSEDSGFLIIYLEVDFKFDVFVETTLVDRYVKCVFIDTARSLFDKMFERNVISSNAIIC